MEITLDIVDWGVVKDKAIKGTLSDELFDIEGNEAWITKSSKWFNQSFSAYCAIAFAFETQLANLDESTRNACDISLSLVLNETADMPKELGEHLDPEYFVGSLSPETVASILNTFNKINQDSLSASFSVEIMEYINEWVDVLDEAAALERGIIVQVV